MIFHDRELRTKIKETLDNKRAVGEGRKTLHETNLPPGTYMERGQVHLTSTGLNMIGAGLSQAGSLIVTALSLAMLLAAARAVLVYEVRGVAIHPAR